MILVAGDLMLDVLLLPELREEEQSSGLLVRGGGSAANTAAWLGWSGAEVAFAGCVGADPAGTMLVDELRRSGVQVKVRTVADETGCVAVELTPEAERVMRSSRGANQHLSTADLLRIADDAHVQAIHLTGYALLAPAGLGLLDTAGHIARAHDALFSFDPSSLGVITKFGAGQMLAALAAAGVGLLLPNQGEAQALTGQADPADAALTLGRHFARVAVKSGPNGAYACEVDDVRPVDTLPRLPRDTTGAGDAFNAGVLRALSLHAPLVESLDEGNRLAGICITHYGARPPFPNHNSQAL